MAADVVVDRYTPEEVADYAEERRWAASGATTTSSTLTCGGGANPGRPCKSMTVAYSTNAEGNTIVSLPAYDLIPDHPLSAVIATLFVLLGNLFEVATELVAAALVLFILNCLMSFLWSYRIKGKLNGELGATLGYRFTAYMIGLGAVIVFSNMAIPEFVGERLREIAFQAVAGIEFVVSLGLLARIVPLFRPIYAGLLEWSNSLIPIADFGVGDIEKAIHSYPGHAAAKEDPEDESADATP